MLQGLLLDIFFPDQQHVIKDIFCRVWGGKSLAFGTRLRDLTQVHTLARGRSLIRHKLNRFRQFRNLIFLNRSAVTTG